ncbi:hypothetical protein NGF19_30040 [Streptomyces sp. RY43-2]|uniref:Uncharacterized protein n=1 Tax=Streptomyces macrolidinus TaxID=2952607 RepID=A0ABT0ZN13_9ACTN|nr:hypothetical protein [Streptomyces macrolidinus]MCN9244976.1 hypothetical protein [Streptomyces macrolidinus]
MKTTDVTGWETAVLDGGPADGVRMKVPDRPRVIQVTHSCQIEAAPHGLRAEGVYVYRRDCSVTSEPLRYGFDMASP